MNNEPFETSTGFAESEYLTPAETKKPTVFSILSLVFGILGVTCCCGGLIPNVLALVFAIVYKAKAGKMNAMAIIGLVLGIVGLVIFVGFALYYILSYALAFGGMFLSSSY